MRSTYHRISGSQKQTAILLVALMILLPWSAYSSSDLDNEADSRYAVPGAWGASGSNDTGWIDFSATGANPSNGTYAYGDLFFDFAPGAVIDNMTFEVKVNGSIGEWAYEPQITLLDSQTPILDWTDLGGFGVQNSFVENQPDVNSAGVLDTSLQPNSVSDTSWQLPTDITITDIVMEALRPADPKVSFSLLDIEIYDTAVNPIDGRLYILLGDDLLHLDGQSSTLIIDVEEGIQGRSLAIDETSNRLMIGTSNGAILQRSLTDSSSMGTISLIVSGPTTGPDPFYGDFESGTVGGYWQTSSLATFPMTADSSSPISGSYSAKSTNQGVNNSASGTVISFDNMVNDVDTDGDGVDDAASYSFAYEVESEGNYDYLVFCIDNDANCQIESGYIERWSGRLSGVYSGTVDAGAHTFTWNYWKDDNVNSSGDFASIDDVTMSVPQQGEGAAAYSSESITAITVDDYGTIWAVAGCNIYYNDEGSWSSYNYCPGGALKTATDVASYGDNLYISTYQGLHFLGYSTSSSSNGTSVSVDSNTIWNTENFLSSNQINDLQILGNTLLIATENGGINRRNLVANSWMATWSTSNWLSSNQVVGLGVTEGWLYILAGNTVHSYNTNSLIFSSQRQLTVFDLQQNGNQVISWPDLGKARSPESGLALLGDGSGVLGRLIGELVDGSETLVSSPSVANMNQVFFVDDGEAGEVWVSGGTVIDRFDEATQTWLVPIDISDYVNDPLEITSFVQDSDGWVWVGTINSGILRLDNTDASYIGTVQGLASSEVQSLAHDQYTEILVVAHYEDGISFVNTSTMTLSDVITEQDGLDSDFINDVVTRFSIAYVATPDNGVMRIDLQELSILSSWKSLGADNLEAAPIAVDGDIIYFGLTGFGILLIDRYSGDIIDIWDADGNSGLPDNDVLSLHLDYFGGLIVGMEVPNSGGTYNGAMARWEGSIWEYFETNVPGGNNDPWKINDIKSDGSGVVAATNRGVCTWTGWVQPTGTYYEWDECISPMNASARFSETFAVELVSGSSPLAGDLTSKILAGTDEGASLIERGQGLSVIQRWTAGDDTQRARIVKVQEILYIGFENTGIGRYNLTSQQWLQTWDGDQGFIDDDDVTVLIPGHIEDTIWAGGDFGLTLIDVVNNTVLTDWNRGSNSGGPTLSNSAPADVVIIGDILHYSTQRSNNWFNSNDQIYRINLSSNSSESTIDAGQELGWDGKIHSIGQVSEELWVGIRPGQYWNDGDGTIARWNTTNETWEDSLTTLGSVERVNAQYLGDCFPINVSSCELWVSYGDNVMRRFSAQTMTLLDEWTDIGGPIRGMVEYQGEYLFASMEGILRWNPNNETWLDSWVVNDGLPFDANDELYTMTTVGDDLWAGSYSGGGGFNTNSEIIRKNGTSGNWTTWESGSVGIPDGYIADIEVCDDIVHIAVGAVNFWGNQGGIARYDLADHDSDGITDEWITSVLTSNGLEDNDVRALACDDANRIIYAGFDEEGVGIARYDYNAGLFLDTLTNAADGISEDRIFPGGMLHDGNVLLTAHQYDNVGGISRIVTSGTSTINGQILSPGMDACSIVRAPSSTSPVYAIGRSGQTSGVNRVDRLDSTGLIESGYDELVGITSGQIQNIISNETNVWVTSSQSRNSYYASSVLQGELTNGTVRWEFGYNFEGDIINDISLDGDKLWVTTAGSGLWKIDTIQRTKSPMPSALHSQMDGMYFDDDGTMYVGLMGESGTAAGYQSFDTNTENWGPGSLISGMPSNIVRDFLELDSHLLIATHGGIGLYNLSSSSFDNPITSFNGLPSPIIDHLMILDNPIQGNGTILAGGLAGLTILEDETFTVLNTLDFSDGLIGDGVSGLFFADSVTRQVPVGNSTIVQYHNASVFISHNGQGVTRPGVAAWDIDSDMQNGTYLIDSIPSNNVLALAADSWGVHIATDVSPLVHWNGTMMQMETGTSPFNLLSWPPSQMVSNGNHLALISPAGIDLLEVSKTHSVVKSEIVSGYSNAFIDSNSLYVVGVDGLHHYSPIVSLNEQPREYQRRAEPLFAIFGGEQWDLTETTHPGMSSILIDSADPLLIPNSPLSLPGVLPMYNGAMTISSPVNGASVWAQSVSLNYTGSWDLAGRNPAIEAGFQTAISNVGPGSNSVVLNVQMQSPQNGTISVRMTYDWERIEVPTILQSFSNRDNDGGGVLETSWLPSEDAAWYAYRIYVWDSTNILDWEPSGEDLDNFAGHINVPFWSQTSAIITEADHDGTMSSLIDGNQYRAAIVTEYPDGSLGQPMTWPFNVTPIDEVPSSPDWLLANPVSGGRAGTINAEWSACTEIDADKTRIWAVEQEITNALALTDHFDVSSISGNNTVLQLSPDSTYWFAAVCVDEGGQSDLLNATIIGPIVTAGGLDDGIPPARIEGTTATDVFDDDGGQIQVNWIPNSESDCTYYAIYALPATSWQPPNNVDGWPVASYVSDCATNTTIISSIGEASFIDDTSYWIGVVGFDDWGNHNLNDVLVVEVTPQSNNGGIGIPPARVSGLNAFDHPDDDGTAIDVSWNRSLVNDFSFYTIWASDFYQENLTESWLSCSDSPESCGLITINQQQIAGAFELQMTIYKAHYGNSISQDTSSSIIPEVPLYVTITTHDIRGNVFLTEMQNQMVLVIPSDNSGDVFPPARLEPPQLSDRPSDDGDGVYITFQESDESDIAEYWIYAETVPFSSLESREPALVVSRNLEMPLLLEKFSDGSPLAPNILFWVSVISVDSSGNYWSEGVKTSSIALINENILDPGLHIPEISGIIAYWDSSGTRIQVEWDDKNDPVVESYYIYLSSTPFEDTRDADASQVIEITYSSYSWRADISQNIDGNSYALINENTYWVAIVGFDGSVHRLAVNPLEVQPWSESAFGSDSPGADNSGISWINQLIEGDMNMIMAIISAIMILIGGALILKPKKRSVPQPWEMGALEVELEEQMFDQDLGMDDDDYVIENESSSQSDNLEIIDPVDYSEMPTNSPSNEIVDELLGNEEDIDLDDLNDLADDFDLDDFDLDDMAEELNDEVDDIDTSFIDDIL